ncbi:MAG: polysaccharide deacetylase family protein [Candidatus Scatovivens sp.]
MFFQMEKYTKIKKIIIYIIIVIISVLIILSSFTITNKIISKKNEREDNKVVEQEYSKHKIIPNHNIEMIKKYIIPIWKEDSQSKIKEIYSSDEKQVFLTFDDGPSNLTPMILDILKDENVAATFFTVGSRVDLYPEIVKREYEEGHYIANHGYTHSYSTIYSSPQNVLNEYISCEQAIKNSINNQEYNSYLFRFPGGSSGGKYQNVKNDAKELLLQNNITFTNWNCLTGDAEGIKTAEGLISRLEQTKGNKTSLIVLMHDAGDKQLTVDTLKQIIENFKNEGYEFKNFYDIFK